MWIGVWAGVRRGETRFTLFKRRYWQFRKADCTVLCDCHHSEIHFLYDILIQEHIAESGKRLYKYTWEEATNLMDKLEESCKAWLLTESPGVVPETYARHKKKQTRERKSRR